MNMLQQPQHARDHNEPYRAACYQAPLERLSKKSVDSGMRG
jgi:hypothetical protein